MAEIKIVFKLTDPDAVITGHTKPVSDNLAYVLKREITSMSDVKDVSDQEFLDALCGCMPVLEEVLSLSKYRVIRLDNAVQVLPHRESS